MIYSSCSYNQKIGKNLRDIRHSLHLTQSELGNILGVSFQQMQKYEKGSNRFSADKIALLSQKFKIPYAQFFEGQGGLNGSSISEASVFYTAASLNDHDLKHKIEKIVEILLD